MTDDSISNIMENFLSRAEILDASSEEPPELEMLTDEARDKLQTVFDQQIGKLEEFMRAKAEAELDEEYQRQFDSTYKRMEASFKRELELKRVEMDQDISSEAEESRTQALADLEERIMEELMEKHRSDFEKVIDKADRDLTQIIAGDIKESEARFRKQVEEELGPELARLRHEKIEEMEIEHKKHRERLLQQMEEELADDMLLKLEADLVEEEKEIVERLQSERAELEEQVKQRVVAKMDSKKALMLTTLKQDLEEKEGKEKAKVEAEVTEQVLADLTTASDEQLHRELAESLERELEERMIKYRRVLEKEKRTELSRERTEIMEQRRQEILRELRTREQEMRESLETEMKEGLAEEQAAMAAADPNLERAMDRYWDDLKKKVVNRLDIKLRQLKRQAWLTDRLGTSDDDDILGGGRKSGIALPKAMEVVAEQEKDEDSVDLDPSLEGPPPTLEVDTPAPPAVKKTGLKPKAGQKRGLTPKRATTTPIDTPKKARKVRVPTAEGPHVHVELIPSVEMLAVGEELEVELVLRSNISQALMIGIEILLNDETVTETEEQVEVQAGVDAVIPIAMTPETGGPGVIRAFIVGGDGAGQREHEIEFAVTES